MHIIARKLVAEHQKRQEKKADKKRRKKEEEDLPEPEKYGLCDCLVNTCGKCCSCCVFDPGNKPIPKSVWGRMWFAGTYANRRVLAIFGFIVGALITLVMFSSMILLFKSDLVPSLVVIFILATILPFGVAFFPKVRVVLSLVIPSLASEQGQALVLAYMLIITTSGSVENFNYNTQVLAVSALCANELLIESSKELARYSKAPIDELSKKAEAAIQDFKTYVDDQEAKLEAFAQNFDGLTDGLKRFENYYEKVKNYCKEKYGTSEELCESSTGRVDQGQIVREVRKDVDNLIHKLIVGPVSNYFFKQVDSALCGAKGRANDFICNTDIDLGVDINIDTEAIEKAKDKVKEEVAEQKRKIDEFFYYDIVFNRTSEINETESTNYTTIIKNIREELYTKVQWVTNLLFLIEYILIFFSFFVVFVAMYYLHRFHNKLTYDNHYINKYIVELDERRQQIQDRETIFPLSRKENRKYIRPTACRLTKSEIFRSIINLLLFLPVVINLMLINICDLGLWYVLSLIQSVFEQEYEKEEAGVFEVSVEGNGSLSKSYDSILSATKSKRGNEVIDSALACVPHPSEPDWEKYYTLRNFLIYLLLMAIFQSYILRLRHIICCNFYPQRARERAIFLYNEIIMQRRTLKSLLRRSIRRRSGAKTVGDDISIGHLIAASLPLVRPIMNSLGYAQKYCIGCGVAGRVNDLEKFIHCTNYGCKAVYCKTCYNDLNNLCTACMHPVQYGDPGDVSEERDSSDDDEEALKKPRMSVSVADPKLIEVQQKGEVIVDLLKKLHEREHPLAAPESDEYESSYYYGPDGDLQLPTNNNAYTSDNSYSDSSQYMV